MPRPYASAVIDAPVDEVWEVVRDFDGLPGWHPAIAASRLDPDTARTTRVLTLQDGGRVVERLIALDDHQRACTYEILESPFAIRRYVATIRLTPVTDSGRTFGEWWGEYDADAADEPDLDQLFAGAVYANGLKALQERFG